LSVRDFPHWGRSLVVVRRWVVELLRQAIPVSALVVAVDPGKVSNRVWLTSGAAGLIGEPGSPGQ
jgi:hypothetical protein